MARFSCKRGCNSFNTNSPMKMIHHNIVIHNAKYSVETVIKIACHDRKFKDNVLRLLGWEATKIG